MLGSLASTSRQVSAQRYWCTYVVAERCIRLSSPAEAIVQALQLSSAENRAFALASVEGEGPGEDKNKWDKLFTACYSAAAQRKASVTV